MKIYNKSNNTTCTTTTCTTTSNPTITMGMNPMLTTGFPPTVTNVAIGPNRNTIEQALYQTHGRYKTLGVAVIDPKLSYVCGATTLQICGGLNVCGDISFTGDLIWNGGLIICDLSSCNIDISQNLTVQGDTTLTDLFVTNIYTTNIDVTLNLTVDGDTTLVDVSATNIDISQNLIVQGDTILCDLSACNIDISQNLTVQGDTILCDLSACNIDISQNLTVQGNTILTDVSATNVDITQDLTVSGDTTLVDVVANIIRYKNNSDFFNWGVHIIPISGRTFQLCLITRIQFGAITGRENVDIIWGERDGGWIYPGYGGYGILEFHDQPPYSWSDRSSYPTDGFSNPGSGYEYAITQVIPYAGSIEQGFSRFSWMMGKYNPVGPSQLFTMRLEIYLTTCDHGIPLLPTGDPIASVTITAKCGNTTWGHDGVGIEWGGFPVTVPVTERQGIGLYIRDNLGVFPGIGVMHSPATFSLEIQRDV